MIDELTTNKLSPFYERPIRDLWLYCLGIGVRGNRTEPLKAKSASIPVSALSSEALAAVISVSIAKRNGLDFLITEEAKEIFKEAEEYANGGLDLVYEDVFGDGQGTPLDRAEEQLRQRAGNGK